VKDSTLRVEMNALEEQADNAKARDAALLEAHVVAWNHQAHLRQRCVRPIALDDFRFHDAGVGVPVFSSLPRLGASPTARLLSAVASGMLWTCTATIPPHAQLTQVQSRRTTGWCPYWGRCSARPTDTRYALNTA
jgi:hypothetical protein